MVSHKPIQDNCSPLPPPPSLIVSMPVRFCQVVKHGCVQAKQYFKAAQQNRMSPFTWGGGGGGGNRHEAGFHTSNRSAPSNADVGRQQCCGCIQSCRCDIEGDLGTQVLAPCAADININDTIMSMYLEHLLPAITRPGSDNNFGSAAMQDVLCLQVITRMPPPPPPPGAMCIETEACFLL